MVARNPGRGRIVAPTNPRRSVGPGTVFVNRPGASPGRPGDPAPNYGPGSGGTDPNPYMPQPNPNPPGPTDDDAGDSGGGGGGGGGQSYAQRNAIATMKAILDRYGLGTLYGKIVEFVQNGYDQDSILALIRDTPEYKQRFPAMDALASKGRGISEAEYIAYETAASGYERMYGLPAGMLGKDAVTNLLTKEVSAKELEERVVMAAAAASSTAPEVQSQFQEYYGVGPGGLTAYFLDPDVATPLLQKQYASSRIGAEAKMQGLGVDKSLAEQLNLAGVTAADARTGFGKVVGQSELASGRGDVTTETELIQGNLLQNEQAQKNIERVGMARAGRFQGGGGFAGSERGASGIRSSST